MSKRILLMYICNNSGHQRACLAIERALRLLEKDIYTKCINSFNYTNPILEKIINRTYMAVIKKRPEVWEYLYDNPTVVKKTQRLKENIHRYNSAKMKTLLDNFKPDAVICTQAFPCGIVADLKKTYNLNVPLVGILTDYAPHSYWIYNNVNAYIVPSEETGRKLIENGVSETKIKASGIPIDPKFHTESNKEEILRRYSLEAKKPVILIMGGGQGLGPIKKLASLLDKSLLEMQLVITSGSNRGLYRALIRNKKSFKKNIVILPFSENVDELMEIATLLLTKPGGITTAEAMAKKLPMVIINPLPGQEAMNTCFLLKNRLAVKANDEKEAVVLVEELLSNRDKLANIKKGIKEHMKSDSSLKIARFILKAAS
ncbi:glycosyltransferase [Omnitrophica bacterium]|nr:glycosyltransferase [Candidatus Omnitrophota bacterium]